MKNIILLTFDLEEFDLPLEFGCQISEEDQINITNAGLQRLTILLSKHSIPATFFSTSFYAKKNEELIRKLHMSHEIASHSKFHSDFTDTDPYDSKTELETITGGRIAGFRMPRLTKTDMSLIKSAGYIYDSSVNPTCIPGRYNNLLAKRSLYRDNKSGLFEIPASVSPLIRFPLFWLSFKNIPLQLYLILCRMAMQRDSYLLLYFHPWEFADLGSFKIPWYIKTLSGDRLSDKFEKLIKELGKSGEFSTISSFLDNQ